MDEQAKREAGQRLASLRGRESQAAFAARLGIAPTTLSYYETGRRSPDLELLIRLKALTGASLDWLANGKTACAESSVNADLLREILVTIEEETPTIDAASKARLAARLYVDRISASEGGRAAPARRGRLKRAG